MVGKKVIDYLGSSKTTIFQLLRGPPLSIPKGMFILLSQVRKGTRYDPVPALLTWDRCQGRYTGEQIPRLVDRKGASDMLGRHAVAYHTTERIPDKTYPAAKLRAMLVL